MNAISTLKEKDIRETMDAVSTLNEQYLRKETDSLGVVEVPGDKLWGAQTQRSLEHFSIGQGSDPARDDCGLRHLEESRRQCQLCRQTS